MAWTSLLLVGAGGLRKQGVLVPRSQVSAAHCTALGCMGGSHCVAPSAWLGASRHCTDLASAAGPEHCVPLAGRGPTSGAAVVSVERVHWPTACVLVPASRHLLCEGVVRRFLTRSMSAAPADFGGDRGGPGGEDRRGD